MWDVCVCVRHVFVCVCCVRHVCVWDVDVCETWDVCACETCVRVRRVCVCVRDVCVCNVIATLMYFCDAALYFQHHYSSLQHHMIFRNQYNMMIYYQCWKKLINIFWFLINEKLKRTVLCKIYIVCYNINYYSEV